MSLRNNIAIAKRCSARVSRQISLLCTNLRQKSILLRILDKLKNMLYYHNQKFGISGRFFMSQDTKDRWLFLVATLTFLGILKLGFSLLYALPHDFAGLAILWFIGSFVFLGWMMSYLDGHVSCSSCGSFFTRTMREEKSVTSKMPVTDRFSMWGVEVHETTHCLRCKETFEKQYASIAARIIP